MQHSAGIATDSAALMPPHGPRSDGSPFVDASADVAEEARIKAAALDSALEAEKSSERTARLLRWLLVRILIVLGVVFALWLFGLIDGPLQAAMKAYSDWANGSSFAIPLYLVGIVLITSITPLGGYSFATLLTGATFENFWVAWPISYVQVNLAAMLNLAIVRFGSRALVAAGIQKAQTGRFGWLDTKLSEPGWTPTKLVVLCRLPYLSSSPVSYAFALSQIGPLPYFLGNAIGFFPGSFVFTTLGANAVSLWTLLASNGLRFSWELVAVVSYVTLAIGAVATMFVIGKRWFKEQAHEASVRAGMYWNTRGRLRSESMGSILDVNL